ncbi:hypothetical protein KRR26_00715 [Corallococcus sp. M34]|uniref:hypothetical protein n=1 Tax=Citreicoccus inhibens TaxID=2849499 RepID=UPI001C219BDD|nr:hypothetical protein [Citreicoccus inhibens]MBU8894100.1 hypothetical protein [Citreicoccus inhibens]
MRNHAERRGGKRASLVSLTLGLLTALLPKCPLCIAAALSVMGMTAGMARIIGLTLRPMGALLALAALGVLLYRGVRAHLRAKTQPHQV